MKRPAVIALDDVKNRHIFLRIKVSSLALLQSRLLALKSDSFILFLHKGHLFDSGLINHVLDVIERLDSHFKIEECHVTPTVRGISHKSVLMIRVFSEEDKKLDDVVKKVGELIHLIESADASMQHFDSRSGSASPNGIWGLGQVRVLGEREKSVLILGAGTVAGTCAEYLGRSKYTTVTVASMLEDEAIAVASNAWRGKAVTCDFTQPDNMLRNLIEEADVVISLLPAPMHPHVAIECITLKTDLVTASYESDEMRSLRSR